MTQPAKIVPPSGPLDAKIVIIGEAPGAEEESSGLPFVGSSGKLLNALLAKTGINRHECYITNVSQTRPPLNDFSTLYLDASKREASSALSHSINRLHNELRRLHPNVIIPLGGEALRAVTGKKGIDAWRGSIIPSPFGKVVSTYHPARLLRVYPELPIAVQDLKRASEQSKFPEIKDLGLRLELNPSFSRVIEFLNSLQASRNKCRIAVDIETTRGNGTSHVRCLGIADSPTHALCIPFMSYSRTSYDPKTIFLGPTSGPSVNNHWSYEEELSILTALDSVLSDPTIEKVGQNISFDAQILAREFGFKIRGLVQDTMVAAYTLYPELPKGLDFLASLYTEIPYYSDYDTSVDEELWKYNCLDAVSTYQIAAHLERSLGERGIEKQGSRLKTTQISKEATTFSSRVFFENHQLPAFQVMARVGQRGVRQDLNVRDTLRTQFQEDMQKYEKEFQAIAGGEINPGSPKQLSELLYGKLGLTKQYNHKTKQLTTDEDAIEALYKKHPEHLPLFSSLLNWRKRQKLKSTYLECVLTPDNRLVTIYNAAGTLNGRCSSSATIDGLGTNQQNFPKRVWVDLLGNKHDLGSPLRKMFIADPGCYLVKADLSQAQWRACVWDGEITRFIQRYRENPDFDIHRWLGSKIFSTTEEAVSKQQRDVAKNGVYGGQFGMMPKKAAIVYGTSLKEAELVLGVHRREIPEVPAWWKREQENINQTRTIVDPFGRVRVFHDRINDDLYRDVYAAICQMIEADIILRTCILIELLPIPDCELVMQIHDEVVLQVKETALDPACQILKRLMEYPLQFPNVKEPLIIPSDISYGKNWLEQTKWKGK